MGAQVFGIQGRQMQAGSLPLENAMTPVGIGHELELFIVLNQLIEQHFRIAIVDIVVSRPVDI